MTTRQLILNIVELVKNLAFIFLIAFVIRTFLIQSFRVEGSSMEPSFHNGEFVLVEKVAYRLIDPKRGDVIVLHASSQQNIDFIKRIVATPGETVEIRNNQLFVNSVALSEPYLRDNEITQINSASDDIFMRALGPDEYFVMGDNRQSSKDSRIIGPVKRKNIVGKVFFVIWPASDFGLVTLPT